MVTPMIINGESIKPTTVSNEVNAVKIILTRLLLHSLRGHAIALASELVSNFFANRISPFTYTGYLQ